MAGLPRPGAQLHARRLSPADNLRHDHEHSHRLLFDGNSNSGKAPRVHLPLVEGADEVS